MFAFFCCCFSRFILLYFIRCRYSIIAPVTLPGFSSNYIYLQSSLGFQVLLIFFSPFPRLRVKLNSQFSYLGSIYLVILLEFTFFLRIILRCIPRRTQRSILANIVLNISCESGYCCSNHIIVIYYYCHIISISVCYLNLNKVFVLKNSIKLQVQRIRVTCNCDADTVAFLCGTVPAEN